MLSSLTNEFPELISNQSPWNAIAARIVVLYEMKQTGSFEKISDPMEQCIIFGNDEEREIVIVKVLEQIKNLCAIKNVDSGGFEHWLGPETYRAWRWLEKRWGGKASLADEARKGSQ